MLDGLSGCMGRRGVSIVYVAGCGQGVFTELFGPDVTEGVVFRTGAPVLMVGWEVGGNDADGSRYIALRRVGIRLMFGWAWCWLCVEGGSHG